MVADVVLGVNSGVGDEVGGGVGASIDLVDTLLILLQVPVQRCPQHEAYPILKEALIRVLPVGFTSLA